MKLIVTGATGLVGAEVLREAILNPEITEIAALTRKPLTVKHAKIKEIVHADFLKYDSLTSLFSEYDACAWCLGVSQSQVTAEAYETITYGYAVTAAKAMLTVNPSIKFLFVSGGGADSSEKSKTLFARVKGKTENALKNMPFKNLVIVRPGGIKPINKNPDSPLAYKLFIPLFPILELVYPSGVISSVQLAKTILNLLKTGTNKPILENPDLKAIAKTLQAA
jgi:uncharacterized protein YbjT (DUF2867 family)